MSAVVFGSGNLASHLVPALCGVGLTISGIYGRSMNAVRELAEKAGCDARHTNDELPEDTDMAFLMIPDSEVEKTAARIPGNIVLIHTSGSVSIDVLKSEQRGVLYPLQTFSKQSKPDMHNVPFFIEANTNELQNKLKTLAQRISPQVFFADSDERKLLHLSAVFACNFVNHMYFIANEILSPASHSIDALRPLILETAYKALSGMPYDMQTGPATRNDSIVISDHIELMKKHLPDYLKVYKMLSDSIQDLYNKRNEDDVCLHESPADKDD